MEKLFSVPETAKAWSVSRHSIRKWIHEGRIPTVRMGRRVFVKESTIASIIENGLPEGKFQSRKK